MSLDAKARKRIGPSAGSKPDHNDAPLPAGLYLVATPIGNIEDITLRALRVLRGADLVACEDTRVSHTLLAHYGIAAERAAYHEHNAERMRPRLLARLEAGARIALISDAGTPLVSDPGFKLVREALARDIAVTLVPGASAPLAALVLSGLPAERFLFAGFLPAKRTARRRALEELRVVPATLLFFESAPRLAESLTDMLDVLGDRPAAVARELTKLYEEVRRAPLSALAAHYRAAGPPKGEIVVLAGPPEDQAPSAEALDDALTAALARASVKDATAEVAAALGLPKREVYARALALAGRAP
jgi:16S rRNA (cytidine1402-2'-O)-methyltransferase